MRAGERARVDTRLCAVRLHVASGSLVRAFSAAVVSQAEAMVVDDRTLVVVEEGDEEKALQEEMLQLKGKEPMAEITAGPYASSQLSEVDSTLSVSGQH